MGITLETPEKLRKSLTMLCIEDSTTMGQILKGLFSGLGFNKDQLKVISGKTAGRDVLAYIENLIGIEDSLSYKIPNVVLLDWNMDIPGIEILKTIRGYGDRDKRISKMLVIMVTAEAMKENIITAVQAGVSSYIIKPPSPDQIEKKLGDVSKIQHGMARKLAQGIDVSAKRLESFPEEKKKAVLEVIDKSNSSIALDIKNMSARKFREEFMKKHEPFFKSSASKDLAKGGKSADSGNYKDAKGTYLDAIKLNPSDPEAHIGLGKMHMKNTDYANAIHSFEVSLEQLSDNPEALELLGESQLKLAKSTDDTELYDDAIKNLTSASELYDSGAVQAKSLRDLGEAHAAKGETDKATECYKKSLELESEQISTQMSLAVALKSAGREKEAEEAMSKAVDLTPSEPQELLDLGKVWIKKDDNEKAMHYFKLALDHKKASKEDVELYEEVINCLFEIGKLKEAIPLINIVADERPDLYNVLGLAYVKNGEYLQGIVAYTKALTNDVTGERYAYLHNRGMAHSKAGDKEKAKKDFSDAYMEQPNPATATMLQSLGVDAATLPKSE